MEHISGGYRIFEDGFCIKDASLYSPKNLIIIANTLFSEQEITAFKRHDIGRSSIREWRNDLKILVDALQDYVGNILEDIEVKYHIPQKYFNAE
jgi:hypothetical protein